MCACKVTLVSTTAPPETARPDRSLLRERLLAARLARAASPAAAAEATALGRHLCQVLAQLEPALLGLYWSRRSEFNAAAAVCADKNLAALPMALPFARKTPTRMEFRAWGGCSGAKPPPLLDECGIPASDGPVVVPDVVIVPCVGYTRDGYRLGYGGGYFDRWLAAHPAATAIGIAGSQAEITAADFQPLAHDVPLMLVVNEHGVVGA